MDTQVPHLEAGDWESRRRTDRHGRDSGVEYHDDRTPCHCAVPLKLVSIC